MKHSPEFSVTLTPELFARLQAEARELGVPMEWVVASLVVDTISRETPVPALV